MNIYGADVELYFAAKYQHWDQCKELLNSVRCFRNPNKKFDEWGRNAFHFAVINGNLETVQLMLKHHGDASIACKNGFFEADALQTSAFFGYEDIFNVLSVKSSVPKYVSILRGCCQLAKGNRVGAANRFFDSSLKADQPLELMKHCIQVAIRMANFSDEGLEWFFNHLFRAQTDLTDEKLIEITYYLIHETEYSYELIPTIIDAITTEEPLVPHIVCELGEILFSVPLEVRRKPELLKDSLFSIVKCLLDCYHRGSCPGDLVRRLAIAIDGFENKSELLPNKAVLRAPFAKAQRYVKFLLTECHCDPNCKNKEGDSALHVLLAGIEEGDWTGDAILRTETLVYELLDNGAHPCARNAMGLQAFRMFFRLGSHNQRVRSLQCIAASKLIEANIIYTKRLPRNLHKFVKLH